MKTECLSFLTAINAHNHTAQHLLWIPLHNHVRPPSAPVLQDCGRLLQHSFRAPLSSLGFHEATQGCSRPHRHPGSPAVLMALGRRHEQEDLRDLPSAAVTRCLQPASYQVQQPDKPTVRGCTPLSDRSSSRGRKRRRGRVLKSRHKQQQPHQFRDWRIRIVKMPVFRVIPWDL